MSACYRCQTVTNGNGDPIGVCDMCSSFACSPCGVRIPGLSHFRCAICWPAVLLHSAGVAPGPDEGGDGGSSGVRGTPTGSPDQPDGGGGGAAAQLFASSNDFEERVPGLAQESGLERHDWRRVIDEVIAELKRIHEGDGRSVIEGLLETRRADTDEEPNVVTLHSIGSGLLLADQVAAAESEDQLDRELFADALGVASWAINVDVGMQPAASRLGLLTDTRIAFVIGVLSPAYA